MNNTGVVLSISATIWRSTAESAPKLETSAIRPGNKSSITRRINSRVSMPANLAPSLFVSAKRSPSFAAIKSLLERLHSDPPVGREKILRRAGTELQIGIDDRLDRVDDLVRREAPPGDRANGASLVGGTAKGDLVGLGAGLLKAENSDMADMVMPAGIDAAGNIDLELADFPRARAIAKPLGNPLRDGDRAGGRETAIIESWAGDDVGYEASVRGGETLARKPIENLGQISERDMRQHEILFMGDADLVLRKPLGEICDLFQGFGAGIAWNAADWF